MENTEGNSIENHEHKYYAKDLRLNYLICDGKTFYYLSMDLVYLKVF